MVFEGGKRKCFQGQTGIDPPKASDFCRSGSKGLLVAGLIWTLNMFAS